MIEKFIILVSLLGLSLAVEYARVDCIPEETIYGYNATLLDESETISFDVYQDKVILIYNVATYCDLTVASYNQINAIAANFTGRDVVILGFPTNEFDKREPGADYDEILNGVTYVRPGGGFDPQLTYFQKTEVNGENQSEIYAFLKSNCPYVADTYKSSLFYSPIEVGDVHWNFEKFLLGRDGKVYYRYNPTTTDPADIIPDIEDLLSIDRYA